MLHRMHLLTTSFHMNNIMPNVMLDALGLSPVNERLGQEAQHIIQEHT